MESFISNIAESNPDIGHVIAFTAIMGLVIYLSGRKDNK